VINCNDSDNNLRYVNMNYTVTSRVPVLIEHWTTGDTTATRETQQKTFDNNCLLRTNTVAVFSQIYNITRMNLEATLVLHQRQQWGHVL